MVIDTVIDAGAGVILDVRMRALAGRCPRCGQGSVRAHSRYQRRLADAPIGGRSVLVRLQVRRFFCDNPGCPARTFAEQPAGLALPRSRRTSLLGAALTVIAVALAGLAGARLAGRAGARLAGRLGMPIGRETLLRLLRALPDPQVGPMLVLGVDDFALRRGHVYGTIVIDMPSGRPIDLLADRETATLAAWLRERPGVEVICRDRAGAYAEATRLGAPAAVQVADRWHLWRNPGQAVEKTVATRRAHLLAGCAHVHDLEAATATEPASVSQVVQAVPEKKIIVRMREQHAAVHELVGQGRSKAAIGRQLGLHPATVRKLAHATLAELTAKTEQRAHLVDDHVEYLHRRWNEGERNATRAVPGDHPARLPGRGTGRSALPAPVPRRARTCRVARPETPDRPRGDPLDRDPPRPVHHHRDEPSAPDP